MTDQQTIVVTDRRNKVWPVIAIIAIILIFLLQIKGCQDSQQIQVLQSSHDSIKKNRDSIGVLVAVVVQDDSFTRVNKTRDSILMRHQLDSMKVEFKKMWLKYVDAKDQAKQALAALSETIETGDTTGQVAKLEDLSAKLQRANDVVNWMNLAGDQKDSAYAVQMNYQDATIDSLKHYYSGLQGNLDRALADLQDCIKQAKAHKRVSLFRTIGEVALVLALIFKK
jgi:hypothetical protein